ncbi:pimeloyl-ACP methyl esterase BioG family protein [Ruegeria sp. SCPT10]|uniref:pimeloyl-ACP methyl esterase BioG family protein n=1 Tax=Ruegeria sp. SCP10 TaxID=3141377 RepID=UPI00333BD186
MKRQWLFRADSASLTVVFGGWAVGAAAFAGLSSDGAVLLVEDYTRLDDPLPELAQYDEVTLVSFSFGVASAAHWMAQTGFIPTRQIAISGTLWPADKDKGIAPDLIRATAENLSDDSFVKFCRRAGLKTPAPAIDIKAARAELGAIVERGPAPDAQFDRIWIPKRDRIIPTQAQVLAWDSQPHAIRYVPTPHFPFEVGQSWADWIK